jgi:hypothetical protein
MRHSVWLLLVFTSACGVIAGGGNHGGTGGHPGAAGSGGRAGSAGRAGAAGQAGAAGGGGDAGSAGTHGGGGAAGTAGGAGAAGHAGGGGAGGKAGSGGGGGAGGKAGAGGGVGGAGHGGAAGGGSPDGGVGCALTDLMPDAGATCGSSSHLCDPPKPDGGFCREVPSTNAATTSFTIWVEDPAAPDGGWHVTLPGSASGVSAGGHTYTDLGDGLVGGGGNGIYGDVFVARDGQAKWTGFHMEGWPRFRGGGLWDWPAVLTVSRAGTTATATVGRHYTITRMATACPGGGPVTYVFTADDPPRACAFGVDLLSMTFPGS